MKQEGFPYSTPDPLLPPPYVYSWQVNESIKVWNKLKVAGYEPQDRRVHWGMCVVLVKAGDYSGAVEVMEEEKAKGEKR